MGKFHVHVNAFHIQSSTIESLLGAGFTDAPLYAVHNSARWYAPTVHLSFKHDDSRIFKNAFALAARNLEEDTSFSGFVEGELVVASEAAASNRSMQGAALPSHLTIAPYTRWREAEIHLTVHSRYIQGLGSLHDRLIELGFGCVRTIKHSRVMMVYSVQGDREPVKLLYDMLLKYLNGSLKIPTFSIKYEKSINFWISPKFDLFPDQLVDVQFDGYVV